VFSERFEAFSQSLGSIREFGLRVRLYGRVGMAVDELVGEKEAGEQQLAGLRQSSETGKRFAALGVHQPAGGAKRLLFAVAACDSIRTAGDD
jgi:hypothetical protein